MLPSVYDFGDYKLYLQASPHVAAQPACLFKGS